MSKIYKFDDFVNEGVRETLKSTGNKMKRVVTGKSAGEEIQKLPEATQKKLELMYRQDPTEAARYLRSIIIKEKNSQFGLGLALAVAGAGMVYKAYNFEQPKPTPKPEDTDGGQDITPEPKPGGEQYIVKKGDSWWRIAERELPPGSSNKDILAYTKQLAADNGAQNLYSGKFGSPGLKADTWSSMSSGESVPKSIISAADKLTTGEEIIITPFKGA